MRSTDMLVNLENKVAFVTGAGRGIGAGIARVFAAAGATTAVVTKTAAHGQKTIDGIRAEGGAALLIEADVGRRSQAQQAVSETVRQLGRLDILIHNAGVCSTHSIEELPDAALNETLNVNLKAAFWLVQAAVPHLRKAGGARILCTSSVTGPRVTAPGLAHYAASKAGLNGFIKTAALELAKDNITVNGVEPGYILTPAMAAYGEDAVKAMAALIPMRAFGQPADVANAMLFLASDAAAYITGQTLIVDGGSTLPESQVLQEQFESPKGNNKDRC